MRFADALDGSASAAAVALRPYCFLASKVKVSPPSVSTSKASAPPPRITKLKCVLMVSSVKLPVQFVYTGFGTPGSAPPKPPIPDKAPVAAVGVLTFDGAGNLSLVYTISINGVVSSASDTGTYTIISDAAVVLSVTQDSSEVNHSPFVFD